MGYYKPNATVFAARENCIIQYMEQMSMDGREVLAMDYHSRKLPGNVQKLKPSIYKDGDFYCCILGPDPQSGIFGRGSTPEEAIFNWESQLRDWIVTHPYGDALAQFVINRLSSI